jgi:hypothetical protein
MHAPWIVASEEMANTDQLAGATMVMELFEQC